MKKLCISGLIFSLALTLTLPVSAARISLKNALIVNFDDRGDREQHIFKGKTFYQLQDGLLVFRAESDGNCTVYIPEENLQGTEKCSQFAAKIKAMTEKMRAQMGVTEDQMAMMKKLGGGGRPEEPLTESGSETIANIKALCFNNSSRKVCVSEQLDEKIRAEGFDSRKMARNLAKFVKAMGTDSAENKQLQEIYKKGYPVVDMETASTPNIPGWNFLDEATKKRIMAQMGNAGGGAGGSSGKMLLGVEKATIELNVPELEELTLEQMMSRMMQQAGM